MASSLTPIVVCLLVVGSYFTLPAVQAQVASGELLKFDSVYEPSGVQQLPDGRILIVEDEKMRAVSVGTFGTDGQLNTRLLSPGNILGSITGQPALGDVDDVEGVAVDHEGFVFAIASHAQPDAEKTDKAREKMVRFKVAGDRVDQLQVSHSLKQVIASKNVHLRESVDANETADEGGFNIEGLSFDRHGQKLLIGLRSPLVEHQAVIAVLNNPMAMFDQDQAADIDDRLIFLDLDKGGIRAMVYDEKLAGYLLVGCRESDNSNPFKLWFWDGDTAHSPRRVRVPSAHDMQHAEGISVIQTGDSRQILLVIDDGKAKSGKGGHYLVLSYDQLQIDDS